MSFVRVVSLLIVLTIAECADDKSFPLDPKDVGAMYVRAMRYPLRARATRTQGIVVVEIDIDDAGNVRSASALSGNKLLIEGSLENISHWKFRGPKRKAIVLYRFKIEGLCELPCESQFKWFPPNFAEITIGEAMIDHIGWEKGGHL